MNNIRLAKGFFWLFVAVFSAVSIILAPHYPPVDFNFNFGPPQ